MRPDFIVYIAAKNDTNGNPRRGWYCYRSGMLLGFRDEGYAGLPREWREVNTTGRIDVIPEEYRAACRLETVKP